MPTRATAAAVVSGTPSGVGYSQSSPTAAYSAKVPWRPSSPWLEPQTRSPTWKRPVRGPTASTVPARSQPGMKGLGSGMATVPVRM